MKNIVYVVVLLFSTLTHAAGIKSAEIPMHNHEPALNVIIWTPCSISAETIKLGALVLSGQRNCPVAGNNLPLVVISHGHGGSNLSHHFLAESLADAGFVVAAINHPGDHYADSSQAGEIALFLERPKEIKRLIDYMLKESADAKRIDLNRIGFFGFSRGGYSGLVLAGGKPNFLQANVPCDNMQIPMCVQIKQKKVPSGPFTHDARIKAFVLADPLNMFPTSDSVKDIHVPIQLWASEFAGDGVLPGTVQALGHLLQEKPELHLVSGSAHFAFLAPCSAELKITAPEICVDRQNFDRENFHRQMNASVLTFYKEHL